jgi:hypothetical protein
MSRDWLPPPPPECLVRSYPSSQKGGTIIAEDVVDLETHRKRLCDPDGYRPERCLKCLCGRLHVHDYRERKLRGQRDAVVARIARYVCWACGTVWRVLPVCIARWLPRTWRAVESRALGPPPPRSEPLVPERTVRRWRERLATAARHATQVLATSGDALLEHIAGTVGLEATRAELALTHAGSICLVASQRLASLAALLHRLAPGARLM